MTLSPTLALPTDLDGPVDRRRSWLGHVGDDDAARLRAGRFGHLDGRVRVAVIAQLVERALAGDLHDREIARRASFERRLRAQRREMVSGQLLETGKPDLFDDDRLPFIDANAQLDLVLFLVQIDVKRDDLRVRKAPVRIERLDSLEVRVELRAAEVALGAPREPVAFGCGERILELGGLDGFDAVEAKIGDFDSAFFVAPDGQEDRGNQGNGGAGHGREPREHGAGPPVIKFRS